jgi:hypothetical protein
VRGREVTELVGFDARGVMCGRAAVVWLTGSWTVWAKGALVCNVRGRSEAERILRQYGAACVREGDGGR